MAKFIPLGAVLVVTLIAGTLYHARLTDRFSPPNSELLGQFTECIPKLPKKIGDWEGQDELISDKEFALTNCTAYISRRWVNKKTGEVISTYVVSGTARHITIHSPDWCYQGAGFKMDSKPTNANLLYGENDSETATCLTTVFRKKIPTQPDAENVLKLYWTYADDGNWEGPNSWGGAKAYYAGRPAMYKIYFTANATGRDPAEAEDQVKQFAKDVLPTFNSVLFTEEKNDS